MTGHDLALRYERLNDDEREVIREVIEGLERGREVYGPLDIDGDARDFEVEALQEHRDAVVYLTVETIARRRRRR